MTDYEEEQLGEIEALQSIYSEEINIISTRPHRFTIPVKTEDFEGEEDVGLYTLLKFTLTEKYPDEAPEIELEETENMGDDHIEELRQFLAGQAEENVGMVMVFTIVSAAIEWLGDKSERITADREEAQRRKKEAEDEEERKKLEGTKVTIESFLAWKKSFDEERLRKKGIKEKSEKDAKLTGKELFMCDTTLLDSDIKFLADTGDTAVTVDESLFQDLDDLDLEEDEDDDPDWKPGADSD